METGPKIVNQFGHVVGAPGNVVLRPTKTVMFQRTKGGKPRLRVPSGANLREFWREKDGEQVAYTPIQANGNPRNNGCFQLRVYKSITSAFAPAGSR